MKRVTKARVSYYGPTSYGLGYTNDSANGNNQVCFVGGSVLIERLLEKMVATSPKLIGKTVKITIETVD